jgi:DNA-directed RNA polymerase subunit beta'
MVNNGDKVSAGTLLAKVLRATSKAQDITGGLPRVAELFEARCPKNVAIIAPMAGHVSFSGDTFGKKRMVITNPGNGAKATVLIPQNKSLIVQPGDFVMKGQMLTEGLPDQHEILSVLGVCGAQEYLLTEMQKIYRSQGVALNDKHLELILALMLNRVCIIDAGDAQYFLGELVERSRFEKNQKEIMALGGNPAKGKPVLLGVTKAVLSGESFIAAASFQETARVLTEAAVVKKQDHLSGMKENVIVGNCIPAGTGFAKYRNVNVRIVDEANGACE